MFIDIDFIGTLRQGGVQAERRLGETVKVQT